MEATAVDFRVRELAQLTKKLCQQFAFWPARRHRCNGLESRLFCVARASNHTRQCGRNCLESRVKGALWACRADLDRTTRAAATPAVLDQCVPPRLVGGPFLRSGALCDGRRMRYIAYQRALLRVIWAKNRPRDGRPRAVCRPQPGREGQCQGTGPQKRGRGCNRLESQPAPVVSASNHTKRAHFERAAPIWARRVKC